MNEWERQHYEDIVGRGAGDPENRNSPENKPRYKTPSIYAHKPYYVYVKEPAMHWTEHARLVGDTVQPRKEFVMGDNDPASPEQAGW